MLLLPIIGHLMDLGHDVGHGSLVPLIIVSKPYRVGVPRNVTADHGSEVVLDQRKMSQMVESAPPVIRVVLADGERTVELFVGEVAVALEELQPSEVKGSLDLVSVHVELFSPSSASKPDSRPDRVDRVGIARSR
jgi:hypothetical protein